jgi:acyl-CoA thioesterase FadM
MNLYFRVFLVILKALCSKGIKGLLDPSVVRFRVLPNDLDFNGHMNNGRYLTIMDLGRFDLIMRNGMMKFMLQHKGVPILGAAKIRYRLPLMPFQKFDLETRIICWDERWAFMEQRFIIVDGSKKGAVAAIAIVKGSFYDKRRKALMPPSEPLVHLGWNQPSPVMPLHIQKWQEAEDALKMVTSDNAAV